MKTIGNTMDYIKGNRIGSREAELENSTGWTAVRKVHRSERSYKRRDKHQKKSGSNNPDFFLPTQVGFPSGSPKLGMFFGKLDFLPTPRSLEYFSASAEKHSPNRSFRMSPYSIFVSLFRIIINFFLVLDVSIFYLSLYYKSETMTQHNVFIRKFGKLAIIITVTDWEDFKELSALSEHESPDFLLGGFTSKNIYTNMNPSILLSTRGEVKDITEETAGIGLAGILTGGSNAGPIWSYRKNVDPLMGGIEEMITPKI